ncbi:sulfur carrier protein ThiS [Telmatobacter bradus]|uniref:sulfur carrier protein ThiS n=1 Tax=Telmatobacter bradus TaxID=474953 RepID=UPI003B431C33
MTSKPSEVLQPFLFPPFGTQPFCTSDCGELEDDLPDPDRALYVLLSLRLRAGVSGKLIPHRIGFPTTHPPPARWVFCFCAPDDNMHRNSGTRNGMNIEVNGEKQSFEAASLSIADLLIASGVESVETVSVQRNGEFVGRTKFASTLLAEGDEIDFIYFMGGGSR